MRHPIGILFLCRIANVRATLLIPCVSRGACDCVVNAESGPPLAVGRATPLACTCLMVSLLLYNFSRPRAFFRCCFSIWSQCTNPPFDCLPLLYVLFRLVLCICPSFFFSTAGRHEHTACQSLYPS